MPVMEATRLEYEEVKPLIGARVRAGKEALLSGDHATDLMELLERRGVIVFPGADFSEEELIAFTRTLGDYASDAADGSATRISIDPATSSNADFTRVSFFWHFDGYMNPVPIRGSVMCARVLSPEGGKTEFCNTYAAFEELPQEDKRRIEGLKAVHSHAAAAMSLEPEPSHERFREWLTVKSSALPLVWTHRSGRKSLVIGNTAAGIVGMDPLESMELLVWLRDWATQERFCYSHEWSVGDMVMWDNTGTLHRVTPYAADSGRLMLRTKLAGEEPIV
jgi:alpha-ketoglutarate-dependent taurine dioxygenase